MTVAVVLLAVVATMLAAVVVRLRLQLRTLRDWVHTSAPSPVDEHDAVVIVIHNHDDVAADRNRLARTLSLISPGLVRDLVHRETIRELRARLAEEGIDADVRVRRVAGW